MQKMLHEVKFIDLIDFRAAFVNPPHIKNQTSLVTNYPTSSKDGLSVDEFPFPSERIFVLFSFPSKGHRNKPLFSKMTAITRFGPTVIAPTVSAPSIPCSIHFFTTFCAASATSLVGNTSSAPSRKLSTRNWQSLDSEGSVNA